MTEFLKLLFLNNEPHQLFVLMFYGYIGAILSYLIQVYKYFPRIKKESGFSPYFALKDNWLRGLLTIIIVPVGILFSEELLQIKISPFTSMIAGFMSDKTIDALANRKK